MDKDCILVEVWRLAEIRDTMRIVANHFEARTRSSCMKRKIMQSWNMLENILDGTPDGEMYYNDTGRSPLAMSVEKQGEVQWCATIQGPCVHINPICEKCSFNYL